MKCLRKYQWVKLPRDIPDMGKGLMAYWAMLAFRAAFRKGNASYCGHSNPVAPGMWAGGVVGLKSILGVRSRTKALQILGELSSLGFLKYSLDSQTKKLTYEITDWVVKCSGAECMSGTVYASTGYGFLCLPRNITQRLANAKRVFDEADAWLDLWCHTTYEDYGNAFSFLAPVVQYGRFGSVLTLETLGERWGWEKTKVWRFFKKHGDVFSLYRLPSSYGCLVFNASYPTGADIQLPEQEIVMRILRKILICSAYKCNEVVMLWKRSSQDYYDTLVDDAHIFTYAVELVKLFSDAKGDYANVEFIMQNDSDKYYVKAELNKDEGVYYVVGHVADKKDATHFIPVKNADGEGLVIVKGLEDDAYTVTEVRTDNGYTLLKDNIKIVISQVEATELCDIYSSDLLGLVQNDPRYAAIIKDTGNLKNMPQPHLEHHLLTASATVDSKNVNMLDDDGSANAIVPLKVINTRGFDLPQTGDSGTMAFSIIGILLMACAAVVIVMVFRKKCNSN